ncbi:MAG: vanadium-dependent haloperoxidase, partial [Myxococcota bacterium]
GRGAGAPAARAGPAAHPPAPAAPRAVSTPAARAAPGPAPHDPGIAIGAAAAARLLAARANDGYFPSSSTPFVGGTAVGQWRPTPSYLPGPPAAFSSMAAPWLATVKPFALRNPAQFRPKAPPAVTSATYTRHYREVKALGSLASGERTAAQTDLAYFWSDNFFAQWNRALRAIALSEGLGVGDSARLFALANVAIADAAITAWDSKLTFAFWRPITAIQEGDNDGNPKTIGDPSWQSLINNPNYPDFTSGANNVTGAVTRILQRFFGTNAMAFSVTSAVPVVVQKTRNFTRFSQAADEVVEARILLGIHFRFADTVARRQGQRVADWAFTHILRPLD